MRRWAPILALLTAACAATPAIETPLPANAFRVVNEGVAYDEWPAVARRPWPASGQNGMPAGFQDEVLIRGLVQPTALRFLPDGRLLVTEQAGLLKTFPAADVDEPRVLLDLRSETLLNYQLGLLGLGVDPDFPSEPYVYLSYTRDAVPGGETPTYGSPDGIDECPSRFACPASARLVRFRVDGDRALVADEAQVLIDDWCVTGPNHSIGTIAFGPDGALYAGGGDGADGDALDSGQHGGGNPCGDAADEGGSMRSQDLARGDDAVGLAGTIVRVDRQTGDALPDNALATVADVNARRIVAHGLRNPFRFTFRVGTDELWLADVGWESWEELNRFMVGLDGPVNFGWPCYEGPARQPEWESVEACEAVYADESSIAFPRYSFARSASSDEPCATGGQATSAVLFYGGETFPERFHGALFFADLIAQCLYVMEADGDGQPNPSTIRLFAHPVETADMVVGSDGAIYYTQIRRGEVHRISWNPS